MKQNQIDPKRTYSLIDIAREGLFPWGKNIATVRKFIIKDGKRKNKNILKTVTLDQGTCKRYYIKGQNIINFIAKIENGTYRLS